MSIHLEKLYIPEVQEFIMKNLETEIPVFLLMKSPFEDISIQELANQIIGRRIALKKFPFLLNKKIIFPPHLNLEQTSSQTTAEYKASLVSGEKMADLTCGFGIDAYFLSNNFQKVTLIENNFSLYEIIQQNWKNLVKKASFLNDDLKNFLNESKFFFDVIYLDPARRNLQKNKVFLLQDLSPNILEIQEILLQKGKKILIKLSPLLDLKYLISVLKNLAQIHIVAVKNEVKEILILLTQEVVLKDIEIHCVNLNSHERNFNFLWSENLHLKAEISDILDYLYIPNNAVLKSGAFNLISERFDLKKLHPNTHLYTSDSVEKEFPGRILKVKSIKSSEIEKGKYYNIISKNHPLKPDEIKKKYKIKEGGEHYLIFTQSVKGNRILKSI